MRSGQKKFPTHLLRSQQWHLLALVVLLALTGWYVRHDPAVLRGALWGVGTPAWLVTALLVPVVHQLYVLLVWRLELYHGRITALFGERGFLYYKAGFSLLFVLRPVSILLLAVANAGTLHLDPRLAWGLSLLLLIPTVFLFVSVKKYFGMDRAYGLDHFRPDEARRMPFVREGIFRLTPNAMYFFGFLVLWIPGLLLSSRAALLAALFSHLYIWVHYFFTERPDMKVIYGK